MFLVSQLILAGTIVVCVRDSHAVHIGVDSRVVAVGSSVTPSAPERKVHLFDKILFAHAGFFRDGSGRFNVSREARQAVKHHPDPRAAADTFGERITPFLIDALGEVRANNPTYFEKLRAAPLQVAFGGIVAGEPVLATLHFRASVDSAGKVSVHIVKLACPGDCPTGVSVITLGTRDAGDKFLAEHSLLYRERGALEVIQGAIRAQAHATPSEVAVPIIIVSSSSNGVQWHRYAQ